MLRSPTDDERIAFSQEMIAAHTMEAWPDVAEEVTLNYRNYIQVANAGVTLEHEYAASEEYQTHFSWLSVFFLKGLERAYGGKLPELSNRLMYLLVGHYAIEGVALIDHAHLESLTDWVDWSILWLLSNIKASDAEDDQDLTDAVTDYLALLSAAVSLAVSSIEYGSDWLPV